MFFGNITLMTKRAIIYVENTENITDFAEYLVSAGWTIVSGGRTGDVLRKNKIQYTNEPAFSDYTVNNRNAISLISNILNSVYAPVQTRLGSTPEDNIYLVCINLFPKYEEEGTDRFETQLCKESFFVSTILRNSFSNYKNVLILTDPSDYKEALIQLRTDNITDDFRLYLAGKAMNLISAFDSAVANFIFNNSPLKHSSFMNYLTFPFQKNSEFHNGSNHQQQSCLYGVYTSNGALAGFKKIHGKEFTYTVFSDISLAWDCICMLYARMKSQFNVKSINSDGYEFTSQFTPLTGTVFTVAVKHRSIIGAALDSCVVESFKNTYKYDVENIKNAAIACSAVIDVAAAREMRNSSISAIVAPGFTTEARQILCENPDIRLISSSNVMMNVYDFQLINGGMLVQTKDKIMFEQWHVRTKKRPSQIQTDEMALGMLIAMNSRSHSAVLLNNNSIVGIAQSCTSAKKALDMVLLDAREFIERNGNYVNAEGSTGQILVCDSAIPFTDSVRQLIDGGLSAIIQTGGTATDDEFINYCDEHGVIMVFTGMTHISY